MAAAAIIAPLVSGVTGMMQASYQAEVANRNADIAKWNADRASQRAGIDAQEKDFMETRALLGEQEVAQASSGVSIAGKSQIATRDTARLLGRRDAENIIDEGKMQRHNHLVEAANFKAEAKAAKLSGASSLLGGILGAAGAAGDFKTTLGKAKASPAQVKYPPKINRAPVMRPMNPGGFTYPIFNPMKRRFGH